jgi:hypothetical protein
VTIVRIGATKKYSEGWAAAFGKGKRTIEPAPVGKKTTAKKATAQASTKASTKRKSSAKSRKK